MSCDLGGPVLSNCLPQPNLRRLLACTAAATGVLSTATADAGPQAGLAGGAATVAGQTHAVTTVEVGWPLDAGVGWSVVPRTRYRWLGQGAESFGGSLQLEATVPVRPRLQPLAFWGADLEHWHACRAPQPCGLVYGMTWGVGLAARADQSGTWRATLSWSAMGGGTTLGLTTVGVAWQP